MTPETYEGSCPNCGCDVVSGSCQGCGGCDPHAYANAREETGRPPCEPPPSYWEPPDDD